MPLQKEDITHIEIKETKDKSEEIDINPGESLIIPSNLPHEALMIGDVVEIDTFSPPRSDWIDGSDDYLKK